MTDSYREQISTDVQIERNALSIEAQKTSTTHHGMYCLVQKATELAVYTYACPSSETGGSI